MGIPVIDGRPEQETRDLRLCVKRNDKARAEEGVPVTVALEVLEVDGMGVFEKRVHVCVRIFYANEDVLGWRLVSVVPEIYRGVKMFVAANIDSASSLHILLDKKFQQIGTGPE
jgi:hypothetical protein